MKSKFENRPLSLTQNLTQKLLRETVIVTAAIFLTHIIFNMINDYERLKQQEMLAGRCMVLKITKDKGNVIYVAAIYRGGSESELNNYDNRDTFLIQEKAFQFRKNLNEAIWSKEFVEALKSKNKVEVAYPE